MRPDDLRRLLQQRPFRPFRFFVLETTVFEVHPPEVIMVGQSTLVLDLVDASAPLPLARRTVTIALLHITRLEPLASASAVSSNGT